MGWWLDWLFGKSSKQLESMKKSRLGKIAKLQAEVDAINAELAKHESKN